MIGKVYWEEGKLLPLEKGVVPIDDPWFSGGLGVYEVLKIRNGGLYFPEEHESRLLLSAKTVGIKLNWPKGTLCQVAKTLARENKLLHCNIKMMVLSQGSSSSRTFAFALSPPAGSPEKEGEAPFPQGIKVLPLKGERTLPQAKTLGLLTSLMLRKQAMEKGAEEALLINRHGHITEGTKSNFLILEQGKFFCPIKKDILWGVTLATLKVAAEKAGYPWQFLSLPLREYQRHPGAFLTSTSINVLPIRYWDDREVPKNDALEEIHFLYQKFLSQYKAQSIYE